VIKLSAILDLLRSPTYREMEREAEKIRNQSDDITTELNRIAEHDDPLKALMKSMVLARALRRKHANGKL
jgi:hypothetical protein